MEKSVPAIPSTLIESENKNDELQDLIQTLPKQKCWSQRDICMYKGLWYPLATMFSAISFEKHFKANDTDIILATMPKSGTTWLKALVYTILNRNNHSIDQTPLLNSNPHLLVPNLEFEIYARNKNPDFENISSPRVLTTHLHYDALPGSILSSKCKIVYLCRNPLDYFISHWKFVSKNQFSSEPPLPMDEAFEYVLEGTEYFGPFWNHILGYWNGGLQDPEKILFLKYEDLKKNTINCVKNMAEFLGFPFSEEEEKNGLVEEIVKLCSIESLKNMEGNKKGEIGNPEIITIKNSSFFRKGEVGDWVNYLTPTMAKRMEKLMEEKFQGSGLAFELTASHELCVIFLP